MDHAGIIFIISATGRTELRSYGGAKLQNSAPGSQAGLTPTATIVRGNKTVIAACNCSLDNSAKPNGKQRDISDLLGEHDARTARHPDPYIYIYMVADP